MMKQVEEKVVFTNYSMCLRDAVGIFTKKFPPHTYLTTPPTSRTHFFNVPNHPLHLEVAKNETNLVQMLIIFRHLLARFDHFPVNAVNSRTPPLSMQTFDYSPNEVAKHKIARRTKWRNAKFGSRILQRNKFLAFLVVIF